MVRGLGFVLVLVIGVAVAVTARAGGALTPGDLTWLNGNLNLPADSPVIQTLSVTQQDTLHALIGAAKKGADRKRQEVVNFITKTVGDSFEDTLDEAREPPAQGQPTELGANRPR